MKSRFCTAASQEAAKAPGTAGKSFDAKEKPRLSGASLSILPWAISVNEHTILLVFSSVFRVATTVA
jgi:hypothetical protein